MGRARQRKYRRLLGCAILSVTGICIAPANGQELLKAIEPGTGYSRMKQWVIEHGLVFENFTKDSLVISGQFQEKGDSIASMIHILSKFCAGDDYSGRAYSTTLQQFVQVGTKGALSQAFEKQRQYLEALAGKPSEEGRFPGGYKLRRSRMPDQKGIVVGFSSPQGDWDLGLFLGEPYLMIQVSRGKDELCK